MIIQTKHKIY